MTIDFQNIHKHFGKNQVLRGINLHLSHPGVYAILGPNGSGKTTLIKCLLGMVLPSGGDVCLNGQSVLHQWQYREQIGYLPQIARFPENLTTAELLGFVKSLHRRPVLDQQLVERFDLGPALHQRLAHLSGGTRQKVNLTLAFMYDAPLLVLDEPTSGLDPVALITLKDLIHDERQRGKTILITTHIMDFVEEMANEIVFLLEGKIIFQGQPDALKTAEQETKLERAIAHILRRGGLAAPPSDPTHAPPDVSSIVSPTPLWT